MLVWEDVKLFFQLCRNIPGCVFPLLPFRSGALDELYPSPANIADLALHTLLIITQSLFILTVLVLPFLPVVPYGGALVYFAAFFLLNKAICRLLNRGITVLESRPPVQDKHDNEHWIFLNGVSVG